MDYKKRLMDCQTNATASSASRIQSEDRYGQRIRMASAIPDSADGFFKGKKGIDCSGRTRYNRRHPGDRRMQRITERHQIEGQDERQRVFNRLVDIQRIERGYKAIFHYEGLTFETDAFRTVEETLRNFVSHLQRSGFSNLRTRLNFRGPRYLAEREPWVNYPEDVLNKAGRT